MCVICVASLRTNPQSIFPSSLWSSWGFSGLYSVHNFNFGGLRDKKKEVNEKVYFHYSLKTQYMHIVKIASSIFFLYGLGEGDNIY